MTEKSESGKVNLYDIYAKVCNRKNRGSIAPGVRLAAHEAAEIAKTLIGNPSIANLYAFRSAEKKWSKAIGGDRISLADEFSRVILSGNYYVKRRGVSSAWNQEYRPCDGFIYGATSADRLGWIKLGATTVSPIERLEQIKKRHNLREMSLMYFAEVTDPMRVEDEIRKCLRIYNKRKSQRDSREWFDISPERAFDTAADAIIRSGVNVIRPITKTKAMLALVTIKPHPVEWISYGSRLSNPRADSAPDKKSARHDGPFRAAPEPPDLVSRVASSRYSFPVGAHVFHRRFAAKFGQGVVTSLNSEVVCVYFDRANRTFDFPTNLAEKYLTVQH